jgi:branched-subunit amino acid transport protein AzlD
MSMSVGTALVATFIMGLVTFSTRLFPFVVFRKHKPGKFFRKIQEQLPPIVLVLLLLYSLKDVHWENCLEVLSTLGALAFVATIQLWKNNPLISIFGGTIIYMFLHQFW